MATNIFKLSRWEHVNENLDLLFARVAELNRSQHRLETNFDLNTKIMEQMLKDQQLLSKQMEVTANTVAQLTLNQRPAYEEEPGSPTSSVNARDSHLR